MVGRRKGWIEHARVWIAGAMIAALLVIALRTFSAVRDADAKLRQSDTALVLQGSTDKYNAYMGGGFQAVIALGIGLGLYVGTRAFD